MNRAEVAKVLAVCSAAFPHVNVTRETAAVYAEMLADLDPQHAQQAIRRLLATSHFFPSIAAIREATIAVANPSAPSGAEAWAEVVLKIKQVGSRGRPEWSHPAVAVAVSTLGWWDLCMSDNQAVNRAHFWKVFDATVKSAHLAALQVPDRPELGSA